MTDTTEIVPQQLRFDDETLANIQSFDDALALLNECGVNVENMDDYGSGFRICEDKRSLVKVPFAILTWHFNEGDYEITPGVKREFVSAEIVTKHGDKFILNDGGTGICSQLRMVTNQRIERGHRHPQNGLLVPGGLTVSEYEYTDEKGRTSPAETFYLAE